MAQRIGKLTSRDAARLVSKLAGVDISPDDMFRLRKLMKRPVVKVGRHYAWTTDHCKEAATIVKKEALTKKMKRA